MFRPLGETELARLSDDELIAYLRRAHGQSARTALAILVYGHWHNVARRVAMKVPAGAVEDVTADVLVSAIQSAFDGVSKGEFVVWLRTITARRIADFHRRPVAQTVPLDDVDAVARRRRASSRSRTPSSACSRGSATRTGASSSSSCSRGGPRVTWTESARPTCTRSRRGSGGR